MLRTVAGEQYELIQTNRRNMEIRVLSRGEVRVFVPLRTSLRSADAFVRSRIDWIRASRAQMEQYAQAQKEAHPVEEGAKVLIQGKYIPIHIVPARRKHVELQNETLLVETPDTNEDAVRAIIREFLIHMASDTIHSRLAHYAPMVGKPYGSVTIREQKTRWGSCSSQHNLNFNWKLIMAPPEALDYVVIHELCHLHEFNHSPRFWNLVKHYQSDYETWKRYLKDNGRLLGI